MFRINILPVVPTWIGSGPKSFKNVGCAFWIRITQHFRHHGTIWNFFQDIEITSKCMTNKYVIIVQKYFWIARFWSLELQDIRRKIETVSMSQIENISLPCIPHKFNLPGSVWQQGFVITPMPCVGATGQHRQKLSSTIHFFFDYLHCQSFSLMSLTKTR